MPLFCFPGSEKQSIGLQSAKDEVEGMRLPMRTIPEVPGAGLTL